MAPYFEQYKSALKRGIEKNIAAKEAEKSNIQARIGELKNQIDSLENQQTVKSEEIRQLIKPLDIFAALPQVDVFVPGPENGPVTLSDFARQATQERLESTTEDSQKSAEAKLHSLFQINQALNNSGIDTTREISCDPDNDTPMHKTFLVEKYEITIDEKTVELSARERIVYDILERNEGIRMNLSDIAKRIGNINTQQVGGIINSLRRKIESDPQKPQHIVGKKGGYGVGGITFRRNLPDSK